MTAIQPMLRYVLDPNIPTGLKFIPLIGIAYFLIPDLLLGPFDDVIVMSLLNQLFVFLAHFQAGKPAATTSGDEATTIDGTFTVLSD